MYLKIHESYRKVVALCDAELIGKKFEEGDKQLFLRENFYKGEKVENIKEKLKSLYANDATFNIVGKKSVKEAIESGIISKENVSSIAEIPFALSLL